jgi:hypothetical protein
VYSLSGLLGCIRPEELSYVKVQQHSKHASKQKSYVAAFELHAFFALLLLLCCFNTTSLNYYTNDSMCKTDHDWPAGIT